MHSSPVLAQAQGWASLGHVHMDVTQTVYGKELRG
jgi:hypothetical protein